MLYLQIKLHLNSNITLRKNFICKLTNGIAKLSIKKNDYETINFTQFFPIFFGTF